MINDRFCYTPMKLQEAILDIQQKHLTLEELAFNYFQFEESEFWFWWKSVQDYPLQKIAILIGSKGREQLLYALKSNPDIDTKEKLLDVLRYCMKESLYHLNWAMLQDDYNNICLIDSMEILQDYISKSNVELDSKSLWSLLENATENMVDKIVDILVKENITIKEFFSKYNIIAKSKLALKVSLKFFNKSDKEGLLQNRDIFKSVIQSGDSYSIGSVIERYLEVLDPTSYFEECNEWLLEAFEIPISNLEFWTEISQKAQERFLQWVNIRTLRDFFGVNSRKLLFWRNHYKDIHNVAFLKDCRAIIIYFDTFVIVDDNPLGEYAYLYSKKIFALEYEKYLQQGHEGIWIVDPVKAISAHDAIIERKHGTIYMLKYGQVGILYMKEIINEINKSKEMGVI